MSILMNAFFGRLANVMIRPRTTVREILASPSDRAVFPLVLLASLSSFVSNLNQNVRGNVAGIPAWLLVAGSFVAVAIVMLLFFLLGSWVAFMAGRFLEGDGTPREVRSAIAWGLSPLVWALLYRVPAAMLGISRGVAHMNAGSRGFRITPGALEGGCFGAMVYGVLELGFVVWYCVVASRALAEAHRFSAWRGFGTLVIVGLAPLVIIVAAVLAIR